MSRIDEFTQSNLCFFWEPYPWQKRALGIIREKNTTLIVSSNKIGKSAMGALIVISWALGYEPWSPCEEGEGVELTFKGGTKWFRTSSLGIEPPVDIIITGEDWKLHLGRVIVPELKKWAPAGLYQTKRNEQGVEYYWEWANKSTFTLMSYTQDDDLFESFRAQGAWEDEPPPRAKHIALSRGLLLDNGKTMMTLTPLKEAWILDEILLSGRHDVGIVDGLRIIDNPDLLRSDYLVLRDMGLDKPMIEKFFRMLLYDDWENKKYVTDRGARAERFLEDVSTDIESIGKVKLLKFIKDIDPDDVPPRVFGEFKSLVGRVLKDFDMNVHVIEPFDIPTNWPVVAMIDFHLSTPQAVSYWTVNKQEIYYGIGETWANIDANRIADDIIRKYKGGWNIESVFIDPLSKGDTQYLKNRLGSNIQDTFSIISERLSEHGITLYVASKDKESGIKNLQTMLRGVNGMPTLYIFNTCERHLFEVMRWVFDDEGKPIKENDHFMENAYRMTLTGLTYKDSVITPLPENRYAGVGGWMGA